MNRPASPRAAEPPPLGGARSPAKRVLDPMDRISEVLFGLIMVLTFTGSISAAEAGREEIRTLLFAALGCNLAWGVVDGAMYLMACFSERGSAWRIARAFRHAAGPAEARGVVAGALPPAIAAALDPERVESIRVALSERLVDPPRPGLRREDWRGALEVFLLVTLSTLPVSLPFLLSSDAQRALRLSNAVAVAMLFATGWALGKLAGARPWVVGVAMVVVGLVLVAVTIALGG